MPLPKGPFYSWFSIHNSNLLENILPFHSIPVHQITTKIHICHDSCAVVAYAKICSDHTLRFGFRVKQHFSQISELWWRWYSEMVFWIIIGYWKQSVSCGELTISADDPHYLWAFTHWCLTQNDGHPWPIKFNSIFHFHQKIQKVYTWYPKTSVLCGEQGKIYFVYKISSATIMKNFVWSG